MADHSTLSTAAAWATVAAAVLSATAVGVALWVFKRQSDDRHEERALGVTFSPLHLATGTEGRGHEPPGCIYEPKSAVSNASATAVYDLTFVCTYLAADDEQYICRRKYAQLDSGSVHEFAFERCTYTYETPQNDYMRDLQPKFSTESESILIFRDSANTYWMRDQHGYLFRVRQTFGERWRWRQFRRSRSKSARAIFDTVN